LAEASEKKAPTALLRDRPAGITTAPDSDVIEIVDEAKESAMEVPLNQSEAELKGKEKVQGSPKRTRFASDPREYMLTRVSEAELLFGRPLFVLPAESVSQETPAKPFLPDSTSLAAPITGESLDRSPIAETEARLESDAGLVLGGQPPAELETSLRLGDGLGTEAADLLEPVGEGLDSIEVIDSLGAERLEEHQPETRNSLLSCEEASTSRPGALIGSLREGLLACPLESLMKILPEESLSAAGTGSSGELAEAILHAQLQVSFIS
jgi:hypothetical protein